LLEHAEVFGHWYGTPRDEVDKALRVRKTVILEIDVQGGRQAKMRYPEAIMVFVLPPSARVLAERMNHRGRDDNETIEQRLEEAGREIAAGWQYYEHMVINGDLPQAVNEVCEIIERARNEPASDETADTR
jgi:guanylate kinase